MTVEYRKLDFEPFAVGYRVGDDGTIWTRKNGRWGLRLSWRKLKTNPDSSGYRALKLMRRDKTSCTYRVNVLVLLAFRGPRPSRADACHGNGDPNDNALTNLRWDTRSGNMLDASRHGRLGNA